jgi:hypothetical protein
MLPAFHPIVGSGASRLSAMVVNGTPDRANLLQGT